MVFFEPGRADVQPRAEQGFQRSGVLDALLRTGGVGGAADGLIAGGPIRACVQHGADGGTGSALPGVLRQRAEHIQRGGGAAASCTAVGAQGGTFRYCSTGASAALAGAVSPAWAAVGQLSQRYFRATVSAL